METLSLDTLLAALRANQGIVWSLVSLCIALAVLAKYWEEVRYFAMRVWHRIPFIGTIDRFAKKQCNQPDGWPTVEKDLCSAYYTEYKKYDGGSSLYRKSKDYLAKVGEAGRKPTPAWVYVLAVVLLILEAVGFAFVIGPWVNPNVSATQMGYLAWSVAFFLALISGGLAHFAGSQIHYNNLIGKAHAWWRATPKDDRTPKLKQLYSINLDATFDDDDKPDYQHIMARVHANAEVSQKKNWVVGFFALILIFAVAAFWIRAETLKSIETEMISSLQPPAAAGTMAGPFDLPEISEDINNAEVEVSIQEQIDAIRSASLMTYVVLSVIYIAIQCIMLWLAIAYGFKGIHSKAAWKYTHKFQSADELEDWLETKRNKIRGHANEKLRALQQKRSMLHTTDSDRDDASSSVDVAARHFLAFVSMENMPRAAADVDRNKGVNASGSAAESGKLAPGSSPSTTSRDAMNFHDITEMSDTELSALSRAMKLDLSELQDIQEQQKALKLIGHFGVKTAANEVIEDQEDKVDPIDAATFNDLTELEVSELAMASKSLNIDVEILQDIREQQLVMKKLGMFASKETA